MYATHIIVESDYGGESKTHVPQSQSKSSEGIEGSDLVKAEATSSALLACLVVLQFISQSSANFTTSEEVHNHSALHLFTFHRLLHK